jgi:alpha-ribazole phosphatase
MSKRFSMNTPALMRWWWVRHGPVAGPPGRILGQLDPGADLIGQEHRLAALKRILPQHAYWVSSSLKRARDTATALGTSEPAIEPGLNEQHFGCWQGLTHDEVARLHPTDWRRVWAAPEDEAPAGGESFSELIRRVADAVEGISATTDTEDVVAIAHAGPIRAALALALELRPERALAFVVDPLSVTRIERLISDAGEIGYRVAHVNLDPALPAGVKCTTSLPHS